MGKRGRKPGVALRSAEDRNELVVIWQYLPAFVCRKLSRTIRAAGLDYSDAKSEGVFGLMRAAELYDPDRRVKGKPVLFSTYATWAIRRCVLKACRRASFIHIPDNPGRFEALARKARSVLPFDPKIDLPAPEAEAPDTDELRRLRCNVRRLRQPLRDVLRLRYSEGLTLRETGERMGGLSRERARQLVSEATARLRELMGVAA